MKKRTPAKLMLHRESLRQLEPTGLTAAIGAAETKFGTLCHSCHFGCPNYTLFGSCTC